MADLGIKLVKAATPELQTLPVRTPRSPVLGFAARFISDLTGTGGDFYSPQQPLQPVAPPGTPVRRWDFLTAQNVMYIPRSTEAVKFEMLRWAAASDYVTRMLIETRKDQVSRVPWTIRPKRDASESNQEYRARARDDELSDKLVKFFEHPYPDPEWSYAEWSRALMEDLLVIDAPTVYVLRETPGDPRSPVLGLDVLDGATFTPLIDSAGRRPRPPEPAYQQIIKGLPAIDLTWDDLIYRPRNKRADKLYGFSPVEQIILFIDFALRRDLFKRGYYTEGNMPEGIVQLPDTYTQPQIEQFQDWWDSILSGQAAQRRKIRFIPGIGGKEAIQWTKLDALKDDWDEWGARVRSYAFGVSPQWAVREMNRATAGTAQEMAKEEGLQPLLNWLASYQTYLIGHALGAPDYEFAYLDDREVAKDVQAVIDKTYIDAGVRTRNEVRDDLGLDPEEGGDVLTITTPQGLVPVVSALNPPEPAPDGHVDEDQPGAEKARSHPRLANHGSQHRASALEANLTRFLASQGRKAAKRVREKGKP